MFPVKRWYRVTMGIERAILLNTQTAILPGCGSGVMAMITNACATEWCVCPGFRKNNIVFSRRQHKCVSGAGYIDIPDTRYGGSYHPLNGD